jgi:hypothetical protein
MLLMPKSLRITTTALSWLLLCALACHSCGGKVAADGGTDSASHWLGGCDDDADCGQALSCECGVCTRSCQRDSECVVGTVTAECVSDVPACATKHLCLATCTTQQDCDPSQNCQQELCVKASEVSVDGGHEVDSSVSGEGGVPSSTVAVPDPTDAPSTSIPPDGALASALPDASDGSVPEAGLDGGSLCCPHSPEPDCCMEYGGTRGPGGCQIVCDGMPDPSENWTLGVNSDGCAYWIEPPPGGLVCGGAGVAECRAQDAAFPGGDCAEMAGYKFDGRACVPVMCGCFGCDCLGEDCAFLEPTLEECEDRYSECLETANCFPDTVTVNGTCADESGFIWDGTECREVNGCSVDGEALFPDLQSCTAAHASCSTQAPLAELLGLCTQDSDCVLVDEHSCCEDTLRAIGKDYVSLWEEPGLLWPPPVECVEVPCPPQPQVEAYCPAYSAEPFATCDVRTVSSPSD